MKMKNMMTPTASAFKGNGGKFLVRMEDTGREKRIC